MRKNKRRKLLIALAVCTCAVLTMSVAACGGNSSDFSQNGSVSSESISDSSLSENSSSDSSSDSSMSESSSSSPTDSSSESSAEGTIKVTLYSETYQKSVYKLNPGDPLPAPVSENDDFEGYWTSGDYAEKYEGEAVPEADITLYYKWVPQTYTVKVDYGQDGVRTFTFRRGREETLPELAPQGTKLVGYAESADADMKWAAGEKVKNLAEKGGVVTLYAICEVTDSEGFTIENGVVTGYTGNATEITLPYSATKVEANAFADNTALVSVTIPECYVLLGKGMLAGCTSLEELTVPFIGASESRYMFLAYLFGADRYQDNEFSFSGYTDGISLYMGDTHFENLLIPQSLKMVRVTKALNGIPAGAFYSAYGLEKVILEDTSRLVKVGKDAFRNCVNFGYDSGLSRSISIEWLSRVSMIDEGAFAAYTGNSESPVKVIYPYGESQPEKAAYLMDYPYPFAQISDIPKLEKIKTIRSEAFYYQASLSKLEFGNSLESIGQSAFYFCIGIPDLVIPDSTKVIDNLAFYSNTSLLTVTIGKGIQDIGALAFANNSSLTQVVCNADIAPNIYTVPFSNTLDYDEAAETFVPGYTRFRIYVDAKNRDSYQSKWKDYTQYLFSKHTPRPDVYWSQDGKDWDAKIQFTDGWIVYVTDPGQKFINSVDYWTINGSYSTTCGEYYPLVCEEISWEEYESAETDSLKGKHNQGFYDCRVLLRLWHPELVDYEGSILNDLYYTLTMEKRVVNGTAYKFPVLQETLNDRLYGDTTLNGSYVVSYNKYGIPAIGQVKITAGMPSVVWLDDPEGTYYSTIDNSIATEFVVTYYDEAYNVIQRDVYTWQYNSSTGWKIPIYKTDGEHITVYFDTPYNNYSSVQLDGTGKVSMALNDGKTVTNYKGIAVDMEGKEVGAEGYTVALSGVSSSVSASENLSGTISLYDWFDGKYHRAELTLGEKKWIFLDVYGSYGTYFDQVSEFQQRLPAYTDDIYSEAWRYTSYLKSVNINESVKVYSFYTDDTKTTLIKSYVRKYDSKGIEIAFGFGSQPDKDGHFTITYQDQSKEEAQIIDARGSYTVGDTVYTRYVDAEDLTLVYYETFLGTNLYYYTVKLDGYGHMYFLDEHDDGICNMYTGTYADFNSYPSATSTYYEYEFNGFLLDEDGNQTDQAYRMWFTFDWASLYAYYEDEPDCSWVGTISMITEDQQSQSITVYDSFGYKVYDITVDSSGNATYIQYSYVIDWVGRVKYTVVETGDVKEFVAVMSTGGKVVYCLAVNENGVVEFSVRQTGEKDDGTPVYTIVHDGGTRIYGANIYTVVVDYSRMETL